MNTNKQIMNGFVMSVCEFFKHTANSVDRIITCWER